MTAKWPEKGKRYVWTPAGSSGVGVFFIVIRCAKDGTWADVRCYTRGGATWTKRQPWPTPGVERRDWTDAELPGHEAVER